MLDCETSAGPLTGNTHLRDHREQIRAALPVAHNGNTNSAQMLNQQSDAPDEDDRKDCSNSSQGCHPGHDLSYREIDGT